MYQTAGPLYNAVINVVFSEEDTTEPVTLQEAKDWCRIDVPDDDTLITSLITAARIMCENYANLSFINRTVTASIKNGLGGSVLPYGPVIAISSTKDYYGTDIEDFDMDNGYTGIINVSYTAGYNTVPENLKNAIKNQVAFMYENRGDAKLASGVSEESKLILNQVRNR